MAKNDDVKKSATKEIKDTKPSKKADAPKKGNLSGFGKKITRYFRELRGEFKKVTWPTRQTVIKNTAVTLVICAIFATVITLFDLGLGALLEWVLKT